MIYSAFTININYQCK